VLEPEAPPGLDEPDEPAGGRGVVDPPPIAPPAGALLEPLLDAAGFDELPDAPCGLEPLLSHATRARAASVAPTVSNIFFIGDLRICCMHERGLTLGRPFHRSKQSCTRVVSLVAKARNAAGSMIAARKPRR
jgi:hypothetical protein